MNLTVHAVMDSSPTAATLIRFMAVSFLPLLHVCHRQITHKLASVSVH